MHYRNLGRSGLKISEVSVGNWLTQGRTVDQAGTDAIVRRSFELGVNFFDTADVYQGGEAEIALGKALDGIDREDVVIGTKCFFPSRSGPNGRGLSRKHITESVHGSLRRLNTDYLDLMQFHRFDPEVPLEEIVRAIDDLIRQGKVLYWGVSQWQPEQIAEVVHISREFNAHPPISNQPDYNMLSRWIERAVVPTSERLGLGQVVYSPLAQGVLTGKYLPGAPLPADSRAADDRSNQFMGGVMTEETLTRVQRLKAYVEGHGYELAEFALAWCLRLTGISCVIIGASRVSQVEANVKASALQVPAEVFTEAEAILAS